MASFFKNRDIISITDFTKEEILYLCKVGKSMYEKEKKGERHSLSGNLKNRTLASMFYEPSTRTRFSFHTAIRELGGGCDGFSGTEGTSVMKKETIRDTIMMMGANHFDAIVMRHPLDGSIQWAADVANIPVINGGDGKNEHPTQALLDILTLYMMNNENLDGISIGFGGDLSHGRTIRSLSLALSHFRDVTIRWAAEDFLGMPGDLTDLLEERGVRVIRDPHVRTVLEHVDFFYMTRPQIERMEGVTQKQIMEMMDRYRINSEKVEGLKVKLMHPLPVNSEVAEIDYPVYFSSAQAFFLQAEFGIFLRKALLYEMLSTETYLPFQSTLPGELAAGNNRLYRAGREKKKEGMFIDTISSGTVIDHLKPGTLKKVEASLDLENRGYSCIAASIQGKKNPFLKTNLARLTERDLKRIALVSPEPTINHIENEKVAQKYVYLLCSNANCVSRVITEDVPPKFYADNSTVRCRYCRRPLRIESRKVTEEDRQRFIQSLPPGIDQVKYD